MWAWSASCQSRCPSAIAARRLEGSVGDHNQYGMEGTLDEGGVPRLAGRLRDRRERLRHSDDGGAAARRERPPAAAQAAAATSNSPSLAARRSTPISSWSANWQPANWIERRAASAGFQVGIIWTRSTVDVASGKVRGAEDRHGSAVPEQFRIGAFKERQRPREELIQICKFLLAPAIPVTKHLSASAQKMPNVRLATTGRR